MFYLYTLKIWDSTVPCRNLCQDSCACERSVGTNEPARAQWNDILSEAILVSCIFDTDGVHVPGTECDFQFSRSGSRPTHGRLYSPRYPSIYPNNVRCSYHFHARPKERVKIVFEEVALQKGDIRLHIDGNQTKTFSKNPEGLDKWHKR
ncbi:unnamed protein product [Spodoptera exigua]|nr:unnamed protein product [Spodoptera exigua]